jgi:peptidoglycan/LPS O-acetylase OafA/YrhL
MNNGPPSGKKAVPSAPPALGKSAPRSPTFAQYTGSRENNYDVLRFVLASVVVFAHSFHSVNRTGTFYDPLLPLTRNQLQLGHLAVQGFFTISGALVAASWDRSATFVDFLRKRALRIYPGFIVCYLGCLFVIAPLSGLTWQQYTQQLNLPLTLVKIVLLRGFGGFVAFPHNPVKILNTSLWTIPYEFGCYMLLAALGVFRGKMKAAVVLCAAVLYARSMLFVLPPSEAFLSAHPVFRHAELATDWIPSVQISAFFIGSCFHYFKQHLVFSGKLALLAGLLLLVASQTPPLLGFIAPFAVAYLLFFFVYHPGVHLHSFGKYGDVSYGIYLWGWPIQQTMERFFDPHLNGLGLFLVTMPVLCVIAYGSWTFIERPFMRLKQRPGRAPAAAPAQ